MLLAALGGCQHQQLARQEARDRIGSLTYTAEVLASSEATRPPRLLRTVNHAGWYFRHQTECFGRNLKGAGDLIERDIHRGGERLPRDAGETLRILYGSPERIEPNAILLFF